MWITGTDVCDCVQLESLTLTTDIQQKTDDTDEYQKVLTVELSGKSTLIQLIEIQELNVTKLVTLSGINIQGGQILEDIAPGPGLSNFLLASQEINPYKDQGSEIVEVKTQWISKNVEVADTGTTWQELDWEGEDVEPTHEVTYEDSNAAPIVTTWEYCVSSEAVNVVNDFRTNSGIDQYRTRVTNVQFYDVENVTKIRNLDADIGELFRLPYDKIPSVGYNNGTYLASLTIAPIVTPRKFVLTEFQVVPLYELGSKMARVKYRWDLWGPWTDWGS
jgi:hypothetical protein